MNFTSLIRDWVVIAKYSVVIKSAAKSPGVQSGTMYKCPQDFGNLKSESNSSF